MAMLSSLYESPCFLPIFSLKFIFTDQKIYNLVTVRKRRDTHSESRVPEELDQKLRSMNIETISAVSSLQPEQHSKLMYVLKDKKRLQVQYLQHILFF